MGAIPHGAYGYDFNFPRNYHPEDSESASDYYFCQETFENYVEVMENCIFHVLGKDQGDTLTLEPFQRDIIAATFCLLHKKTKRRRYREVFIYIPRKNGKTFLCAALVIGYLLLDDEPGKEIISAARNKEQASKVFEPVRISLRNPDNPINDPSNDDPNLRFNSKMHPNPVIFSENELNKYFPVAADGEALHGGNCSFAILDELHAWKEKQGLKVYEAIDTSMDTRDSPLIMNITTAGYEGDTMCNRKLDFAQDVCDDIHDDPTFLPVLYYLDKEEDWENEENWYKVNPMLGKSVTIDNIREKYLKAKRSKIEEDSFKRLRLNIQTRAKNKFLSFKAWKNSELSNLDMCKGLPAFGGLDMAYKGDMCALAIEVPRESHFDIFTKLWIPEGHKDLDFYRKREWLDTYITVTSGDGIDFAQVREDIAEFCESFNMVEFGYDPRFATELCQALYNPPYNLPMLEVAQTPNNLSEALNDLAVKIGEGKFHHDGNDCASWQIGNATKKEMPNQQIKLIKPSGDETTIKKVDFVAALSMAHSRFLFQGDNNLNSLIQDENYSFL